MVSSDVRNRHKKIFGKYLKVKLIGLYLLSVQPNTAIDIKQPKMLIFVLCVGAISAVPSFSMR